jgi:hypothetical protein
MVCLVDTYMELGAALLPYLEGLDTTQLQLVTAYAHRLSQARAVFWRMLMMMLMQPGRQLMGIDCRRCSGRLMVMQPGRQFMGIDCRLIGWQWQPTRLAARNWMFSLLLFSLLLSFTVMVPLCPPQVTSGW